MTALVVQDLLGGELLTAEVAHADGSRQGVHYWNRLAGGLEVDLTREQFTGGERIGPACVVPRPADITRGRLTGQYHLLAAAVRRRLDREDPLDSRPVSVKGVCVDSRGRVLLCLTARGEYELPGGRPEPGELFPATLEREIREEAGLTARVERVLSAEALEVVPGAWVDILAYSCRLLDDDAAPRVSAEPTEIAFLSPARLVRVACPDVYRRAITLAAAS